MQSFGGEEPWRKSATGTVANAICFGFSDAIDESWIEGFWR